MTLSERNTFFKVGIAFCAVCVAVMLTASFFIVPVYKTLDENSRRPADFFQFFVVNKILQPNYYAVHASLILSVLFSLVGIILIHFFFEQTSAPEIPFIAIFTISLSFEVFRLILPLRQIFDFPSFYLLTASRVLLFARYFSIFSLFAASVCAAGLEVQKTRTIFIVVTIAALIVTFGVPVDAQNWDTSLNMITGYTTTFRLIDGIAFLITVISFFVAVNVRSSKEYSHIGVGIMLALIGRYFLLQADNWAGPIAGILFLSFGTGIVCSRLHKIHLWL
jgi:hypothetical protein